MSRLRTQSSTLYVSSRFESYTVLTHRNQESSVWSGISLDSFVPRTSHSSDAQDCYEAQNPETPVVIFYELKHWSLLDYTCENRSGNRIFDVVVVGSSVQFCNHRLVFPEFHLVALGTLDRTETLPQCNMVSTTRVEEHLATVRTSPTVRATVIDALSNLYHHDLHAKTTSRAIQQMMNTLSQVGISLHTSFIILSL